MWSPDWERQGNVYLRNSFFELLVFPGAAFVGERREASCFQGHLIAVLKVRLPSHPNLSCTLLQSGSPNSCYILPNVPIWTFQCLKRKAPYSHWGKWKLSCRKLLFRILLPAIKTQKQPAPQFHTTAGHLILLGLGFASHWCLGWGNKGFVWIHSHSQKAG